MPTTPDNASEQAKDDAEEARRLIERANEVGHADPGRAQGMLIAAQTHALLYIGDQVKALVEALTHPAPAVAGMEAVSPDVLNNPIRALLKRDRERAKGLHAAGRVHLSDCVCDHLCRAITEANR